MKIIPETSSLVVVTDGVARPLLDIDIAGTDKLATAPAPELGRERLAAGVSELVGRVRRIDQSNELISSDQADAGFT